MNSEETARKVVHKMMSHDRFSQWLGIEVIETGKGFSALKMTVRDEMLNGFDILHGGVTFSLADSALAFASNSYGIISVVLDAGMSFPAPVHSGDELIAVCKELNLTNKTGIYEVIITKNNSEKVGIFKGIVYRTGKQHFPEN